jgi:hypothetical protein
MSEKLMSNKGEAHVGHEDEPVQADELVMVRSVVYNVRSDDGVFFLLLLESFSFDGPRGGNFLGGKPGKWHLGVPVVAAHTHEAPNIVWFGIISRGAFKLKCTTIYRLSYRHALYPAVAHTEAMTALKYPNDDRIILYRTRQRRATTRYLWQTESPCMLIHV